MSAPGMSTSPSAPILIPNPVRMFSTFTVELERLAAWLHECGVNTVAMESTGVYWIPLFGILEAHGVEVCLGLVTKQSYHLFWGKIV